MIKAYVKNGVINLITKDGEALRFPVGSAVTTIGEENTKKSPYELFSDFKKSLFTSLKEKELTELYELRDIPHKMMLSAIDDEREDKLYLNREFKTAFESINGEVTHVFFLSSAYDLFAYELIEAFSLGKSLKKCECCGKFFFPSGRSDSLYCERVGDDGFSCKKIGAHRKSRKHSLKDSAKLTYIRVMKHNRYLRSRGIISEYEFSRRKNEASLIYVLYKRGEISENTLYNRLSGVNTVERGVSRREISDYLL